MKFTQNVHEQFAQFFKEKDLEPFFYLLSKKLSEGHICIRVSDWIGKEVDELYSIYGHPPSGHPLISDGNEKKPLVFHHDRLYLERYFNYETIILNRILDMVQQQNKFDEAQPGETLVSQLFSSQTREIDWQMVAAILAMRNRFTIITGGPGTGKTTTVAKILAMIFSLKADTRVALAAPTGKAASRMAESLKNAARQPVFREVKNIAAKFEELEPSTIHRLLGSRKNSIYFKHNRERPLNYDVIIVDESSMIDVALFAKLLDAVLPGAKVIFLGDKNQLASVEAGSLFGELCTAQPKLNRFSKETAKLLVQLMPGSEERLMQAAGEANHPLFEHVIELQKSHRFSSQEGIGKLSRAIIEGNREAVAGYYSNTDDRVFVDTSYSSDVFFNFIEGYKDFIEETDTLEALKKLNKLRILCAVREGEHGVNETNRHVERYLQTKNFIKITGAFYENRPVMVTRNYYNLGLFNGDTGIVRKNDKGELAVFFEEKGELREVPTAFLSGVETVFAMTIHKSQGSEFDQVLIILPETEDLALLTRELLYTGVTRARNKVVIQAQPPIVEQTILRRVERSSGIQDRLKNSYAAT